MITVGMDLEQFLEDPFGSGIQRVLQQLTLHWPASDVGAPVSYTHLTLPTSDLV